MIYGGVEIYGGRDILFYETVYAKDINTLLHKMIEC